jgi:acyl-coenzyme A thioesterase PaaI-like protein
MPQYKHLKYDPALLVSKPYYGDPKGSFVVSSSQMEIALQKSSVDKELLAEVWFSIATAGPPGHVHGGCQAAVLDEMMGSTGWHHGYAVVAAKIEVEFLEMVPVNAQYSLRGWITSVQNRKIYVEAELIDKNKIYARSTGLFITLTEEQKQELAHKVRKS